MPERACTNDAGDTAALEPSADKKCVKRVVILFHGHSRQATLALVIETFFDDELESVRNIQRLREGPGANKCTVYCRSSFASKTSKIWSTASTGKTAHRLSALVVADFFP